MDGRKGRKGFKLGVDGRKGRKGFKFGVDGRKGRKGFKLGVDGRKGRKGFKLGVDGRKGRKDKRKTFTMMYTSLILNPRSSKSANTDLTMSVYVSLKSYIHQNRN